MEWSLHVDKDLGAIVVTLEGPREMATGLEALKGGYLPFPSVQTTVPSLGGRMGSVGARTEP